MFNKNKAFIISTFLFSILFVACASRDEVIYEIGKNDPISVNSSIYEINLDQFTPFGHEAPLYLKNINDSIFLCLNNKPNKSIDMYLLGENDIYKRIKFSNEANEKIQQLAATIILNWDSIYLINNYSPRNSIIIDSSGSFKSYLTIDNELSDFLNIIQSSSVALEKIDQNIYFMSWESSYNGSRTKDPNYKFAWKYNTVTGNFSTLPVKYPSNYVNSDIDGYAALPIRQAISQKKVIYLFPQSDTIKVFDTQNGKISTSFISCDNNVSPPYKLNTADSYTTYASATFNEGIYFDKVKGFYYLIRSNQTMNLIQGTENSKVDIAYQKPLTIHILDKDFNQYGVIKLPKCEYSYEKIFVHNGNLFISRNNYYSKNLNENKLRFEIFDISVNPI